MAQPKRFPSSDQSTRLLAPGATSARFNNSNNETSTGMPMNINDNALKPLSTNSPHSTHQATPQIISSLSLLHSSLQCPLCNQLFTSPVATLSSCAHSFCYTCITKYSAKHEICPVVGCYIPCCVRGTGKKYIQVHPQLDSVVNGYRVIRQSLEQLQPFWWEENNDNCHKRRKITTSPNKTEDDEDEMVDLQPNAVDKLTQNLQPSLDQLVNHCTENDEEEDDDDWSVPPEAFSRSNMSRNERGKKHIPEVIDKERSSLGEHKYSSVDLNESDIPSLPNFYDAIEGCDCSTNPTFQKNYPSDEDNNVNSKEKVETKEKNDDEGSDDETQSTYATAAQSLATNGANTQDASLVLLSLQQVEETEQHQKAEEQHLHCNKKRQDTTKDCHTAAYALESFATTTNSPRSKKDEDLQHEAQTPKTINCVVPPKAERLKEGKQKAKLRATSQISSDQAREGQESSIQIQYLCFALEKDEMRSLKTCVRRGMLSLSQVHCIDCCEPLDGTDGADLSLVPGEEEEDDIKLEPVQLVTDKASPLAQALFTTHFMSSPSFSVCGFSDMATCDGDLVRRTFGYILSVAAGLPIVASSWLSASATKRQLIPVDAKHAKEEGDVSVRTGREASRRGKRSEIDNKSYLVIGCSGAQNGWMVPQKARDAWGEQNQKASFGCGLLNGYICLLCGKFDALPDPDTSQRKKCKRGKFEGTEAEKVYPAWDCYTRERVVVLLELCGAKVFDLVSVAAKCLSLKETGSAEATPFHHRLPGCDEQKVAVVVRRNATAKDFESTRNYLSWMNCDETSSMPPVVKANWLIDSIADFEAKKFDGYTN